MPSTRHEKIDTCQVAARSGEASNKTKPDRVFADDEDDGDRRGCRLGRQRSIGTSGRGDHGDLSANQFGRQLWQSIDLIVGPAVFDRDILALDIAGPSGLGEMRAESRQPVRRPGAEEPDYRHRRLLRPRPKRPRLAAAEQCDELPPFQLIELHSIPTARASFQDTGFATISQWVSEPGKSD